MIQPTAIIAEDEENLRTSLRTMLQRLWPELHVCGEAENGEEALELIKQKNPEFIFLDIKMPELSGLEVAKRVSSDKKVIFVTAYDQYAIQAFENEAIDYLLKPITEERLEKTISRLKRRSISQPGESPLDTKIEKILRMLRHNESAEKLRLLKVKTGTEIQLIPVSYICFFKAEHKYTTVQTTQKEYIINTPLRELELRLDPDRFWKVHRSAIVNIDKIDKISRSASNRLMINFKKIDKSVTVSKAFENLFKHM
jgi:DNA-binding LytR/AlgR family response regulator